MTVVDARGTRHRRCDDRAKLRIVSLVPSLTELLCDVGLAHALVGRTTHCVHPADEVDRIATIGGPRSADVERIRALAPTHLLVDVDENDAAAVAALETFVPHVIAIRPKEPRDNLGLFHLVGHVFNCEREADLLAARFEASWSALRQAQSIATRTAQRVTMATEKDPWTTVAPGSYVAGMLALIEWQVAPPTTGGPRDIAGVDRLLLSASGQAFTETDVAVLRARAPHVHLVEGELLSWYGGRAIRGLNYLTRLAADAAPS